MENRLACSPYHNGPRARRMTQMTHLTNGPISTQRNPE